MNRRRFLATLAGGAATATIGMPTVAAAADPTRAPSGSGPLGDWTNLGRSISTPAQFANVAAVNGVLIVGDSITNANAYDLAVRVGTNHGLPLAVNAWNGRPTAPAVDWLEANVGTAGIPDRGLVMACGTNDIFRPLGYWQQVNRVLALADGRPVYWVNVFAARTGVSSAMRLADMRNSAVINEQIARQQVSNPNLRIVEWFSSLAGGHNESNIDAWLSDGVHTTPAGRAAWCDLILAAMGLS